MGRLLDCLFSIVSWAWLFQAVYGFGDFISPTGIPRVHLRFQNGKCHSIRGQVPLWIRSDIASVLNEAEVSRAAIKQLADGRFHFSHSVPDDLRQKIRNLLASR